MKINNFKLAIALPLTRDVVDTCFLDSWTLMEKPEYVYIRPTFPGPIDAIRNDLVKQAIQENCTHIIMMDTDQSYPPDVITKILKHNLDVCGAKVHRRYPPFDALCMLQEKESGRLYCVPDEDIEAGKLIEVHATGTGCILYKVDVFQNIPYPWFEFSVTEDGQPIGEDINFCHKLRKNGYKIFVDCSIEIGHSANLMVNYSTYKLYKTLQMQKTLNKEI